MLTKSTIEMFANNCAGLYVNSAKSHWRPMLGSDGLVTDGSTNPGPGLSRNVSGVPIENHSRAPASCGTVIVTGEAPEAFSGIAQSTASGLPTAEGDAG